MKNENERNARVVGDKLPSFQNLRARLHDHYKRARETFFREGIHQVSTKRETKQKSRATNMNFKDENAAQLTFDKIRVYLYDYDRIAREPDSSVHSVLREFWESVLGAGGRGCAA